MFLQRPELSECWDARVLVRVTRDETLRRALRRDVELFGSPGAVHQRYEQRYSSMALDRRSRMEM